MKVLVKTAGMSRPEWLKWRTRGIGGSDVSILAGINHFKSVFQLWMEKTGQLEPEEDGNNFTHFGALLEPIVKKEFMERTGLTVRAKKALLQHDKYPFMLADVDGVIYENGTLSIFEAKTATTYKKAVWEQGVPEEYQLQVQHYMAVTGAQKTYIAALVGGNEFFCHEVFRDEELISLIIRMEENFWQKNVLGGEAPDYDGSDATTAYLNNKYKNSRPSAILLPEEALALCDSYDHYCRQIDELSEEKDRIANQLKGYLQENEKGIIADRVVTWKTIHSTGFDRKRLKEEHEDIYWQYATQNSYRRFQVA